MLDLTHAKHQCIFLFLVPLAFWALAEPSIQADQLSPVADSVVVTAPDEHTFTISQNPKKPWQIDNHLCASRNEREVVCGEVIMSNATSVIVKIRSVLPADQLVSPSKQKTARSKKKPKRQKLPTVWSANVPARAVAAEPVPTAKAPAPSTAEATPSTKDAKLPPQNVQVTPVATAAPVPVPPPASPALAQPVSQPATVPPQSTPPAIVPQTLPSASTRYRLAFGPQLHYASLESTDSSSNEKATLNSNLGYGFLLEASANWKSRYELGAAFRMTRLSLMPPARRDLDSDSAVLTDFGISMGLYPFSRPLFFAGLVLGMYHEPLIVASQYPRLQVEKALMPHLRMVARGIAIETKNLSAGAEVFGGYAFSATSESSMIRNGLGYGLKLFATHLFKVGTLGGNLFLRRFAVSGLHSDQTRTEAGSEIYWIFNL